MKQSLRFRLGRMLSPITGIFFLVFFSTILSAQVSGTVFRDLPVTGAILNTYGFKDANELGIENVTVTIFPGGASTMTAADGSYSFTVADAPVGDVRVEFSFWPSFLEESFDGGSGNSSVQFSIAPNTSVDFGLHYPDDFSDVVNPIMVSPAWGNGLSAGNGGTAMYSYEYTSNGQNTDDFNHGNPGPVPGAEATIDEIGTTWGIAYQKTEDRFFASTVVRRLAGMADGTGYIYVIDGPSGADPIASFDLNNVMTASGGTIDLGTVCRGGGCESVANGNSGVLAHYALGAANQPSYDIDGAAKVGKAAFGDIEMQPGTNKLWAVNLNQRALIVIDVANSASASLPGSVDQFLLSALPGLPACGGTGVIRPWALTFSNGKGYLGVVCDATTSGAGVDLAGFVLSFDPNNIALGFTTELSIPVLNFARQDGAEALFRPWTNDWADFTAFIPGTTFRFHAPQPILSGIDFNKKGDMIIAVLDRGSMQLGTENLTLDINSAILTSTHLQGDVFHACKTSGGFILENSVAGCNINFATGFGFDGGGEFYKGQSGEPGVKESAEGALAILKGSNVVAASAYDPHPSGDTGTDFFDSHGINFLNTSTGDIDRYYSIFDSGFQPPGLGKSGGMGDLELLTPPAPIEIGNFVWNDINSNGIQDPGELGLSGVVVQLHKGGVFVATATTNANGNYIFSNDPSGVTSPSHRYNLTMLVANMEYTLTVPTTNGGSNLSTANTGEGSNTDLNDTDADTGTGMVIVLATTIPALGANNHTFDFGYGPPPCPPARCGTTTGVKN